MTTLYMPQQRLYVPSPYELYGEVIKSVLRHLCPAVTEFPLTSGQSVTDATSVATSSFSPNKNRLILACCGHNIGSGSLNTPTASGLGQTWTDAITINSGNRGLTVFRCLSAAAITPGAITFDFAGQTQRNFVWAIQEFENVDRGGVNGANAIVQSASNSVSGVTDPMTLTVTLAAFASALNATFGAMVNTKVVAVGNEAGWTQIYEVPSDDPTDDLTIDTMWRNDNDTTAVWSWANPTSSTGVGAALELKYDPTPPAIRNYLLALMKKRHIYRRISAPFR